MKKSLKDLIAELCPDGVEFKKLIEIAEVKRGIRVVRSQLSENGKYAVYQNSMTPLGYYDKFNCSANTTFVISAGAAGEIGYSYEDFWAADDCLCIKCDEKLNSRFLYFYLLCQQNFIYKNVRRASIPRLSKEVIQNLKIPVPPLPVQNEIVRILDIFTKLISTLEEELTARKKQYEYYRDLLLTPKENYEIKTLGEICEISAGGDVPKDKFSKNKDSKYNIPVVSNGVGNNSILGFTDIVKISKPAVTVAARGTIGWTEYRNYPYFPVVRLLTIIPIDSNFLNTKFLYYCLQGKKYNLPTSGIPQLTIPKISNAEIPIPPLAEQERIAGILDKFDKLCNDLCEGIPAEIEARKKQYEYYRDLLLTFEEAK